MLEELSNESSIVSMPKTNPDLIKNSTLKSISKDWTLSIGILDTFPLLNLSSKSGNVTVATANSTLRPRMFYEDSDAEKNSLEEKKEATKKKINAAMSNLVSETKRVVKEIHNKSSNRNFAMKYYQAKLYLVSIPA